MEKMWQEPYSDWYQIVLARNDPRFAYFFKVADDKESWYLDQGGFTSEEDWNIGDAYSFLFNYAWPAEPKPAWAQGAVGYQIFPDRFRREGRGESLPAWDCGIVDNRVKLGGNLQGIRAAVPYMKALGVDVVYLTPIFLSDTAHRYNTFDYLTIDPILGTPDDLRNLADALHRQDMKLVLDGVFNHCGDAFAPFQDALKNGEKSPYYDWFHFGAQYPYGYETFGFERNMPKLVLSSPSAQDYFCHVGEYWMERCGIDGWRLDVSCEVWPDFYRQFRKRVQAAAKRLGKETLLVAECWDDAREWTNCGDMFDSTMNYFMDRTLWDCAAGKPRAIRSMDEQINRVMTLYPHAVTQVLWNFVDSHDTPRLLTRCQEDPHLRDTLAFVHFMLPGSPFIYYGDEQNMSGGSDPECRAAMQWQDEHHMLKREVAAWYQKLARLRHQYPALRYGTYRSLMADDDTGIYAFFRQDENDMVLCAASFQNTGTITIAVPKAWDKLSHLRDALSQETVPVKNGCIEFNAQKGSCHVFVAAMR